MKTNYYKKYPLSKLRATLPQYKKLNEKEFRLLFLHNELTKEDKLLLALKLTQDVLMAEDEEISTLHKLISILGYRKISLLMMEDSQALRTEVRNKRISAYRFDYILSKCHLLLEEINLLYKEIE